MKTLSDYIGLQKRKYTVNQLHKLFKNELLDLNDTIVKLIDKYCANGGYVYYECQDMILPPADNYFKIDTAKVLIPNDELCYDIEVVRRESDAVDVELYNIYIKGETLILIEGCDMLSLKESIQLSRAINEAEETELYKYIKETLDKAITEGKSFDEVVDEGLFGSILGGLSGATIGPAIMRAVCKALGIDEKGTLGSLMTSRAVMAAVGGTLGYKI